LHLHRQPLALLGMERAGRVAADATQAELARFKPGDRVCVVWGMFMIAASYLLHSLAEFIEHAAH
jgi:NADPH:quinone reductase-like Zn-dependent oxidoreductase